MAHTSVPPDSSPCLWSPLPIHPAPCVLSKTQTDCVLPQLKTTRRPSIPVGKGSLPASGLCLCRHLQPLPHLLTRYSGVWAPCSSLDEPGRAPELSRQRHFLPLPTRPHYPPLLAGCSWALRAGCPFLDGSIYHTLLEDKAVSNPSLRGQGAKHRAQHTGGAQT